LASGKSSAKKQKPAIYAGGVTLYKKIFGKRNLLARIGSSLDSDLRHRLEAAGADVDTHAAATLHDSCLLDIRQELPLCLTLRETYLVAAHRPLATYFTFRHNFTLPNAHAEGVQTKGDRAVATNFNIIKNNP